ncbi:MAG: hypothetical protein HW416_2962 [Chloroflexi bacterium]|nr:hypothetical protein [Chloroflexota bacterium]
MGRSWPKIDVDAFLCEPYTSRGNEPHNEEEFAK